jgi:hypothetical protein
LFFDSPPEDESVIHKGFFFLFGFVSVSLFLRHARSTLLTTPRSQSPRSGSNLVFLRCERKEWSRGLCLLYQKNPPNHFCSRLLFLLWFLLF